ncbi:EVE domain protein [Calidithermus terrae]|uniref:EVE domain protein n=1 Tax=Calidithermus terrae TaxID=1408545 RepID=A0A399EKG0_9DEIN|nr:EVE domain-containing protein [Calidithermus terrae]RIH84468.1 EVE domain protein [Calidithermus terrae]
MAYWLLKSEPDAFSIADLERIHRSLWDGVRNYQARNFLRSMQPGDLAFFYHSSTEPPGVVGVCRVVRTGVADPTQFDPHSEYHDPAAQPEKPRWWTVEVEFVQRFGRMVSLETLRQTFTPDELWVVRRGNRLSVMPVSEEAARRILELAGEAVGSP